jgi:acetylornithine aminotransferase/acetylornithine/N-succinyldiaminopimelate aminotransferase
MMTKHHILLNRTHDTVLRFLPPFLITRAHIDQTIAALDQLLTEHAVQSNEASAATTLSS